MYSKTWATQFSNSIISKKKKKKKKKKVQSNKTDAIFEISIPESL